MSIVGHLDFEREAICTPCGDRGCAKCDPDIFLAEKAQKTVQQIREQWHRGIAEDAARRARRYTGALSDYYMRLRWDHAWASDMTPVVWP